MKIMRFILLLIGIIHPAAASAYQGESLDQGVRSLLPEEAASVADELASWAESGLVGIVMEGDRLLLDVDQSVLAELRKRNVLEGSYCEDSQRCPGSW